MNFNIFYNIFLFNYNSQCIQSRCKKWQCYVQVTGGEHAYNDLPKARNNYIIRLVIDRTKSIFRKIPSNLQNNNS